MNKTIPAAEWRSTYGKIVAQAWNDGDYKERLVQDPRAVLSESGVSVPPEMNVSVLENSDENLYLVLPQSPADGEISEEALAGVGGGFVCASNISVTHGH